MTWSEGYLTVVDGAYTFAEPKERGMYFKWKSKYGIKFEGTVSSSTKYQGVVYGPDEQSIPNYADVPYGDVDPCSLVAPAGTWRMPTSEQLLELGRRRGERIRALCVQNVQRRHAEYLHGAFRTVIQGWYEDHAAEYHFSMDGR